MEITLEVSSSIISLITHHTSPQLTNFVAVQPAANKVDAMKNFIVLLYITSYDKGKDYYIDVAIR